ncbi:MAG: hypothetical protein HFH26_03925 [Clostridiaceae bacterium]|nr:hypothetical protein [Clostridiaceae bacterium]
MKLISIQGHFGCISGEKITFEDGFCRRTLPNGWGKSTLCAFIRVMLYGLNTSKRDTSVVLADKNRYVPLDGRAMGGRLTLEYQGRNIVLLRMTGRGGPMQEFEAFYEDTGEDCSFLTAKNCGETLLGISEEVFRSSAFIDGEEMMRPSGELADMIVSLAQSGDTSARGAAAVRRLERWRLDFDSGNGHGVVPKLRAELERIEGLLEDAANIERDLAALEEENGHIAEEVARLEAIYEEEYRQNAGEKADEQNRLTILRRESERRIKTLRDALPADVVIQQASDALFSYEGAVRLEREKREVLPPAIMEARQQLVALDRSEHEAEIENNRRQRPRISWVLIVVGLLLAVAAAGSAIFQTDWGGALSDKIPYILSACAIASIFFAFLGSVPQREEEDDFDGEREALRAHLEELEQQQQMAATVLREAYEGLLRAAGEIQPVQTIEEAADVVRDKRSDLQALRREQDRLHDILYQIQKVIPGDSVNEESRIRLEEKRGALRAAQKQQQIGLQNVARLQGRMQSLGNRQALTRERVRLQTEIERARARGEDVQTALRVVREEQAALSARLSPTIARLATEYLEVMTGGELSEVQLDDGLTPRAAGEDGRLLGALQLSSGMRDQMYLAFRLAVCETLPADEPIPLILDDPFITFDSDRVARGEAVLHELAGHRQVILLVNN